MAPSLVVSLNSLYILCVPVLLSYLNNTPYVLARNGFFSLICSQANNSPFDFFSLYFFHKVPESRFCICVIFCKNAHSINIGVWVFICWCCSSNNVILKNLLSDKKKNIYKYNINNKMNIQIYIIDCFKIV